MWRFLAAAVPLVAYVHAEENCTSVGVVSDGYEGTLNSTGTGYGANGVSYVLQDVDFGDDRRRRNLAAKKGARLGLTEAVASGLEQARVLTDEEPCPTKMWILADTDNLASGFPYYAAFDCSDNPGDINSTWLRVTSEGYSVASAVVLTCLSSMASTSDPGSNTEEDGGDDGGFPNTTAIVAIVVGIVALLCICGMVGWFIRKRTPQGSTTFENESELAERKMMSGSVGETGTVGDGSTVIGVGMRSPAVAESSGVTMMATGPASSVGPGIAMSKVAHADPGAHISRSSFKGAHIAPMQARTHRNTTSFKAPADVPVNYEAMFPSSHGMSVQSGASAGVKDSMVAAAAAAGAAASRSSGGTQERYHQGGGEFADETDPEDYHVARGAVNEDDIVWSAGNDRMVRAGRRVNLPSDFGEDSAAGSEFSLNPDNVPDRAYYDTESMATSSPGAYSMYSHFTAGGHSVFTGDVEDDRYAASDVSWSAEEASRPDTVRSTNDGHGTRGMSREPPPRYEEPVEIPPTQGPVIMSKEPEAPRSPAGMVARVDRSTREGSRRTREPQ